MQQPRTAHWAGLQRFTDMNGGRVTGCYWIYQTCHCKSSDSLTGEYCNEL
jgi:hypothetical protein